MSDIILKSIEDIKNVIPEIKPLTNDYVYGILAYKYFFNDGKYDKSDFKNSYTDGPNDGGIDLIAVEEGDFENNLVLIQSKNVQSINSKDDIKDIFTKMAQTVFDFRAEKVGGYNDKLRKIYREKFDDASDGAEVNIKLVLVLGFDKNENYRNSLYNHLNKIEILNDFEKVIYFRNELDQQIQSFEEQRQFVSNGKINIFKEHGVIKNGDNGLLVNISANSLRKLYDLYKKDGLFGQNFRYYIKNEKIDDQIENSLKQKRQRFWFLNNGIIICCKNFTLDGDNIKLIDFSIVNGCQTTTMIGKYKGPNEELDFPIQCKIIKPDQEGIPYFNSYISEIAEASNSQKPISDRDLKSNQTEQRDLQRLLKQDDPKIFIEIKRGEELTQKRNFESWQKIKNDQLGQLILAAFLQKPGTARSGKKKIFSTQGIYNSIFKRKTDKETIIDLLKLSVMYDRYISNANLSDRASNVSKNGKLSILAIICFLIKFSRKQIDLKLNPNSTDWVLEVTMDNLYGPLFNPKRGDDYEKVLNSIFNDIIQMLASLYTSIESTETSVTNFFKTDNKYHSIILERVRNHFLLDEYEFKKFNEKFVQVFN